MHGRDAAWRTACLVDAEKILPCLDLRERPDLGDALASLGGFPCAAKFEEPDLTC
jgi:hypothetical protein